MESPLEVSAMKMVYCRNVHIITTIPVAVWISKERRLRRKCLVTSSTTTICLEEKCFIRLKINNTNLVMQQLQ